MGSIHNLTDGVNPPWSALKRARHLVSLGLSVIPIRRGTKAPDLAAGEVTQYWDRLPTDDELQGWFAPAPADEPMGIVTGWRSGIVVIDTDTPEAEAWAKEHLPETPWMVDTPRPGRHRYYRHPGHPDSSGGEYVQSRSSIGGINGLDCKADGGYILAPGSIHPDGGVYTPTEGSEWPWTPVSMATLPVLHESMLPPDPPKTGKTSNGNAKGRTAIVPGDGTIPEGSRNTRLTQIAGALVRQGIQGATLESLLLQINEEQCNPPLEQAEVSAIVRSTNGWPSGEPDEPADIGAMLAPLGEVADGAGYTSSVDTALVVLAEQAKGLSGPDYTRLQTAVLGHLQRLKVPRPARTADGILPPRKSKQETTDSPPGQGTALVLQDPDPWPDEVDLGELLGAIREILTMHLHLPQHADVAISLWVLHTHALDAAQVSPRLAITSPALGCGKTTLLLLLSAMVPRPLTMANLTAAIVYRTVEAYHPSLLADEADTWLKEREELRGVLNSGHLRASAYVARCVGDSHEPRLMSTWCACAIACIGRLHPTLASRSIEIRMHRLKSAEEVTPLRADRLSDLEPIRRMCARWVADHLEDLRQIDPHVPSGLSARAADNWRPLLGIADLAGGDWPDLARHAAPALSGRTAQDVLADGDASTMLLGDLRQIWPKDPKDRQCPSKVLIRRLCLLSHRPWAGWHRGKELSARAMAKMLEEYDIRPCKVGPESNRLNGYDRDHFADVWSRYLPPPVDLSGHPDSLNDDEGLRPDLSGQDDDGCPDRSGQDDDGCPDSDRSNPNTDKGLSGCPDSDPPDGDHGDTPTRIRTPESQAMIDRLQNRMAEQQRRAQREEVRS